MAGSHTEIIETPAKWVLNHTFMPDTHTPDQLQFNEIIKPISYHSIWATNGVAMAPERSNKIRLQAPEKGRHSMSDRKAEGPSICSKIVE